MLTEWESRGSPPQVDLTAKILRARILKVPRYRRWTSLRASCLRSIRRNKTWIAPWMSRSRRSLTAKCWTWNKSSSLGRAISWRLRPVTLYHQGRAPLEWVQWYKEVERTIWTLPSRPWTPLCRRNGRRSTAAQRSQEDWLADQALFRAAQLWHKLWILVLVLRVQTPSTRAITSSRGRPQLAQEQEA